MSNQVFIKNEGKVVVFAVNRIKGMVETFVLQELCKYTDTCKKNEAFLHMTSNFFRYWNCNFKDII